MISKRRLRPAAALAVLCALLAPGGGALARAGGGGFQVTDLSALPTAQAPKALDLSEVLGAGFSSRDMDVFEKHSPAIKLDQGDASPEEKSATWRRLPRELPHLAAFAERRAAEWDRYAAQQMAEKQKRIEARDRDWKTLSRLLARDDAAVSEADKGRWSGEFLRAYRRSPGVELAMAAELLKHVEPGAVRDSLETLARPRFGRRDSGASGGAAHDLLDKLAGPAPAQASEAREGPTGGEALVEWISIPAGSFTMGAEDWSDARPLHRVSVKSFQMAKTLVTNKQYAACVRAGACTAPGDCGDGLKGEDHPVVCVDFDQASAFAAWVGGRLPSEAEWEYAARSAGKDRKYPWGDEDPTCERMVMKGCAKGTMPVCSKPRGNTEQGLCDMASNVWEWTQDWYHDSYDGAPGDGSAWESPAGSIRVVRGAAWFCAEGPMVRSAHRHPGPGGWSVYNGLRPVRSRP